MISRRIFSRLSAAAAAVSGVAAAPLAAGNDNQIRREIQGSWTTLMTFSEPPPPPIPRSFVILETFLPQGDYISVAALPSSTPAHGSWDVVGGQMIRTRSRLIVLPDLLGVAVQVEIMESITLAGVR